MCQHAKDTALFSLKLAIVLSVSWAIFTLAPYSYDTYYNMQVAKAMPEVIFSVLIVGGIGSAWLQALHRRSGKDK
jgi:hypothetical protein